MRLDDAAGRRWSAKNYPGGYTSYGSVHWLQRISPTFKALQSRLERHVKTFADAVDWDLDGRELKMTDCWLNIMPKLVVHGLHLHPLSTLSGTYYVQRPRGCARDQIRGSAAGSVHGGTAAQIDCETGDAGVGNVSGRPGTIGAV